MNKKKSEGNLQGLVHATRCDGPHQQVVNHPCFPHFWQLFLHPVSRFHSLLCLTLQDPGFFEGCKCVEMFTSYGNGNFY